MAVGAILIIIFGYSYLKGSNLFGKHNTFFVKYSNVDGLGESAPVTINGLQVGKVQWIEFANTNGDLVVAFSVDRDFSFSKNSIVQIYSSGFIGGNNLEILPEYDPNNIAVPGDTLQGEIEQGIIDKVTGKLAPLEAKIESTLTSLDTLFISLNEILDDKSKADLKRTIGDLSQTMAEFRGASSSINSLLKDNKDKLNSTIANLDKTSENFAKLSDSLSKIEVGKMIKELESITTRFNGIVAQMENGEGSIGKLLKDDALYNNLSGASHQLEKLLEDMKLNPKRYVHFSLFGKRAKPYEKSADTLN